MKKLLSIILLIAYFCSLFVGVAVPASAAVPERLTQDVIEYMENLSEDEMVPIWISLISPSTEEIEAIVKERISDDLAPQEYYEARLKVIEEIFDEITSSFVQNSLDETCTIFYRSQYAAMLAVEAPKAKVLELAANCLINQITLYEEYEDESEEDQTISSALKEYMDGLADGEMVPIWISLTSPSTEDIETIVKERISDDLAPQEYYEARLKVIEEIFDEITSTFVQNNLDETCTIIYRSQCAAMLAIEAPKAKVLELADLETVIQIDLFTEYEQIPETCFEDINSGDYFFDAVLWAFKNGVTKGTDETHFSPKNTCSRAEVVTFLWGAAGSPEPSTTNCPFVDVSTGSYYYKAVLWAVEKKITAGTAADKFTPLKGCTRAEVVTFLWRAAESPEPTTTNNRFSDVKDDVYYSKAVLWAAENMITAGTGTSLFSPEKTCSRAEIVTFLYRYAK